jgi:hypothetical protein
VPSLHQLITILPSASIPHARVPHAKRDTPGRRPDRSGAKLIGWVLQDLGITVNHVLPDGSVRTQTQVIEELIADLDKARTVR